MSNRRHFGHLDALRGIAAGLVAVYHLGHWLAVPGFVTNGYLAVDFFFCLSGFVVAMAYGPRHAPALDFSRFIRVRLIRLMPLIILSNVIAATYVAVRLLLKAQHGAEGSLTIALLLGTASLPYFHAPVSIGGPQVFPLNGPQYTLFLEIAGNAVWFVFRNDIGLGGSLFVAAAAYGGLFLCGLGGDTTGDFLSGIPRVMASFYGGVAVFHIRERFPNRLDPNKALIIFAGLSSVLLAALLYPRSLSEAMAIICIMVLSPTIVLSGSLCPTNASKATTFLGELSYPIYTMHYPIFCWINGVFQSKNSTHLASEIVTCAVSILIGSWYVLVAFDRPVRRWLSTSAAPEVFRRRRRA